MKRNIKQHTILELSGKYVIWVDDIEAAFGNYYITDRQCNRVQENGINVSFYRLHETYEYIERMEA